ncbi:MAG: hypothetical protein JWO06_1873 [Bacteroidota bacterium]|nr:hypothetical protein [Bacteroidota bacterium]
MKGYQAARKELDSSLRLKAEAEDLLKLFLTAPKTEFYCSEIQFSLDLMRKRGELKDWSTDILKLEGGDAFFCLWFEELRADFSSGLSENYNTLTSFFDTVENNFRRKNLQGILRPLLLKFQQWLMVTLNQDHGCDFCDYALQIKRDDPGRSAYNFARNFGRALQFLNISPERLYLIISHLKEEIYTGGNTDDHDIKEGIKDLAKSQPKQGEELLIYFSSVKAGDYESLVFAGLIENGGSHYLDKSSTKYLQNDHRTLANALSCLRILDNDLVRGIFAIIDTLNLREPDVAKYIPHIYHNIIEANSITDELKSIAFQSLIGLWSLSKDIKPNILYQLNFIRDFKELKCSFLIKAFQDPDIEISSINGMFGIAEVATPDFFYQLIEVIAYRMKLGFDTSAIEDILYELIQQDEGKFSETLIRLMIHDNGFVRYAGSRLYTHQHSGVKSSFLSMTFCNLQKWINLN